MSLTKLIAGFKDFHASYFEHRDDYERLVKDGQAPESLIIACSDSRNDPALLMRSEPGDIFVIRNVAAIVPPYEPDENFHGTSTAIEFAVKGLKVKNIIVLGHALCGGVKALDKQVGERDPELEFLNRWVEIGTPARNEVRRILDQESEEMRLRALEQAMVLASLQNLMTFPWIKSAVDADEINLQGWYFNMVEGKLLAYDASKDAFTRPDRHNLKNVHISRDLTPIRQLIENVKCGCCASSEST